MENWPIENWYAIFASDNNHQYSYMYNIKLLLIFYAIEKIITIVNKIKTLDLHKLCALRK